MFANTLKWNSRSVFIGGVVRGWGEVDKINIIYKCIIVLSYANSLSAYQRLKSDYALLECASLLSTLTFRHYFPQSSSCRHHQLWSEPAAALVVDHCAYA